MTWQARNSVVLALRRGDLVSDAERDALCFHALSGADADFLGIREDEVYVIFPTRPSPCFSFVTPPRGVVVVRRSRAPPARTSSAGDACANLVLSPMPL